MDSRWKAFSDRTDSSEIAAEEDEDVDQHEDEDEDEIFEPIDGCTEENVGWMKLAAFTSIGSEFYLSVFDYPGGGWYVAYRRPPDTVLW